jgi:hypothetical protein
MYGDGFFAKQIFSVLRNDGVIRSFIPAFAERFPDETRDF